MPNIVISDPADPRINVFQGLRDHTLRQKRERPGGDMAGVFICEGDIPVGRAIDAGYDLESILIDGARTKPLPSYVDSSVTVYAAEPQVVSKITGYTEHRGCIACFVRRPVDDIDDLDLDMAKTLLILEGINNPTNMGVILRCGAGLGVDAVVLDRTCSDPLYRRSVRVSMGEALRTPYARVEDFEIAMAKLRSYGFEIWALTPADDAEDISQMKRPPSGKVAVMLGTEGAGLTESAIRIADRTIKIPMSGEVDSINVGAAGAIALYALSNI